MVALIIIPSVIAVWLGIKEISAWRHRRSEGWAKQEAFKIFINSIELPSPIIGVDDVDANFGQMSWETKFTIDDEETINALRKVLANLRATETFQELTPEQTKQLTDNLSKN
jgi:hypothetical protein